MTRHSFTCIEGHTEGMPVRMVIDGAPALAGESMNERRDDFIADHDWICRSQPYAHGFSLEEFFA